MARRPAQRSRDFRRALSALLPALVLAATTAGCGLSPEPAAETPPALQRRGPAPIRVSANPWVLSADGITEDYRGPYLGNGYLGQRLTLTGTSVAGESREPGYLAGLYVEESLAELPPLLPLRIAAGQRVFGADLTHLRSYRQELRLREGLLVTRTTWDTGAGEADLELETAMLRQQPDVALLRAKVSNRGRGTVTVGVPDDALPPASAMGGEDLPGITRYRQSGVRFHLALRPLDRTDLPQARGLRAGFELPAGETAVFALAVHLAGGRVRLKSRLFELPTVDQARVDAWLEGHKAAWARLWERDIEIEGDPEAQQVVRACLFQLLCSAREENDAGIPPMGLSARAFNGHVFWDMDSWMFPAALPQHPELARAMLEYRYRTLPGARANAKAEGLPGASYAWESAAVGREALQGQVFTHGRHVSGDVALALKQYYQATGDREWLRSRAWPILKDTADNWAARAKPDGKGGFVVRQVTTPDENAGQVDHSAWTHHVARLNLRFAADTARELGLPVNPKWEQTARGLGYLRNREGLILSYDGFNESKKSKQADALLLVHPGEERLSDEELGRLYDFYAPRVIDSGPAMTDAIHAIAAARLGRSEEALDRFRKSYQPFVRPPFHVFSEKRTRDNLSFITGAAGVVEAALYGFAGLRLEPDPNQADRPRAEPHLPPGWTALRVRRLHWRGKVWDVEVTPGAGPGWTRVE